MVPKRNRTRGHPAATPTVDELLDTRNRMNRANAEFLKIDTETALTFLQIARDTDNNSRKQRNCRAARRAYDTALKLMPKVDLTVEEIHLLMGRLDQLKLELKALGESF